MVPPQSLPPLVLTLALDKGAFEILDALRKQHFPSGRNWLPAHLTLFHALPGVEEAEIREVLEAVCRKRGPLRLEVAGVRFLGGGVAYDVRSDELVSLRHELATQWSKWLTPQDRQGFRGHVTIQNKVSAGSARELFAQLSSEFIPWEAWGEGLLLWRYLGGPWALMRDVPFAGKTMLH